MPQIRLKPLNQQTIVITGASSGIGLATARLAVQSGARVFLISRSGDMLEKIVQDLRNQGGRADYAVADVGKLDEMEAAARKVQEVFGGFDSWVNDAGVSIYGEIEKVPLADHHRVFETNYWGVVHGSTIAAKALRQRGGGAIINIGSVLSDRAMILQGPYSATKHAVRAFTDALRMELERDGAPISVTLIKPSGIETGFQDHARNYLPSEGVRVPPPAYEPKLVARAILHACEHRRRELVIGFGGHAIALMGALFPRTTDLVMEAIGYPIQVTDKRPKASRADNLYQGREGGTEKSLTRPVAPVRKTSLFLEAQLHPAMTAAALAGIGALVIGATAARRMGAGRVLVPGQRPMRRLAREVGRRAGGIF
jgi:short-subunit dehydrogenase